MSVAEAARTSSDWSDVPSLEAAVQYVTQVRSAAGTAEKLHTAASRSGVRALLQLASELPRVEAPLSRDAGGTLIRGWFRPGRLLPWDRAPVALLQLPATSANHLSGRSKQALRTNITRATAAGLSCDVPVDEAERVDADRAISALRGHPGVPLLHDVAGGGPVARLVVVLRDPTGQPVGLSETVLDGEWAGLRTMVVAPTRSEKLGARYLLHARTVAELIDRSVTSVTVSGSMLLSSPGTRYFQRRTGFRPVWLQPVDRAQGIAAGAGQLAGPRDHAVPAPRTAMDATDVPRVSAQV